jgi:hypothetical protein
MIVSVASRKLLLREPFDTFSQFEGEPFVMLFLGEGENGFACNAPIQEALCYLANICPGGLYIDLWTELSRGNQLSQTF